MDRTAYITTSWDDGHPSDGRVAELLQRHGLRGTFYVPRDFHLGPPLSPSVYAAMGHGIEVGAHTLGHVMLTTCDDATAQREITDSRRYVEDATGQPCTMFCPPCGRFARRHVPMIHAAGFTAFRTVEAFSLGAPRPYGGVWEMPTSVQAFPQHAVAMARNLVKRMNHRKAVRNAWRYLRTGVGRDWTVSLDRCLAEAQQRGGVVHLWGHSWELDAAELWRPLDAVLSTLGRAVARGRARAVTNGQLARAFAQAPGPRPTDRTPARTRPLHLLDTAR